MALAFKRLREWSFQLLQNYPQRRGRRKLLWEVPGETARVSFHAALASYAQMLALQMPEQH